MGDILRSGTGSAERDDDDKTRVDDYLKEALAAGPRRTTEVVEEAKQAHSISTRTLERARTRLSIAAGPRASGPAAKDGKRRTEWWIALPEHAGDLKEPYKDPDDEVGKPANSASGKDALTCQDRQTANPATLQGVPGGAGGLAGDNTGPKTANPATPSGGAAGWRSGGLDAPGIANRPPPGFGGRGIDPQLVTLARGLVPASERPPCEHEDCWNAPAGRCMNRAEGDPASQDTCTACRKPLDSFEAALGTTCMTCQADGAA